MSTYPTILLCIILFNLSIIEPFQIGFHVPPGNKNVLTQYLNSTSPISATLIYNDGNNNLYGSTCIFYARYINRWTNCTNLNLQKIHTNCNLTNQTSVIAMEDLIDLATITSNTILRIDLHNNDGVWFDQIMIINDADNVFIYNIFASSLSFRFAHKLGINVTDQCPENDIFNDDNCTLSGSFCLDLDDGCYSHNALTLSLPLNSNTAWIESAEGELIGDDVVSDVQALLDVYQYCNESEVRIIAIGIHVPGTKSDTSLSLLRTTVRIPDDDWVYLQQCQIFPSVQNSWFLCHINDPMVCDGESNFNTLNVSKSPHFQDGSIIVHFDLVGTDGVFINELSVLDSKSNEYVYNVAICMDTDDRNCYGQVDVILNNPLRENKELGHDILVRNSDDTVDKLECYGDGANEELGALLITIIVLGILFFLRCVIGACIYLRQWRAIRRSNAVINNLELNIAHRPSVTLTNLRTNSDNMDNPYMNFEYIHSK